MCYLSPNDFSFVTVQSAGNPAGKFPLKGYGRKIGEGKALGPEHPDMAATLSNLGVVYRAKDRYTDAEAALSYAMTILARSLGPEHPRTTGAMMRYADILRLMKRKRESNQMKARARGRAALRAAELHGLHRGCDRPSAVTGRAAGSPVRLPPRGSDLHRPSFPILDLNYQALAEHPRRPCHRVQGYRHIPRVQQPVQLRPAGLKVSRHGLLGLLLLLHLLRELPCQHPFDRDRFHLFANAFLFEKAIETRSAMVEGDLLRALLHGSPLSCFFWLRRATNPGGRSPLDCNRSTVESAGGRWSKRLVSSTVPPSLFGEPDSSLCRATLLAGAPSPSPVRRLRGRYHGLSAQPPSPSSTDRAWGGRSGFPAAASAKRYTGNNLRRSDRSPGPQLAAGRI